MTHIPETRFPETARCLDVCIDQTILSLPAFFPSVSSVKTNLAPVDYVELLVAANHPSFLTSAYDLFHCSDSECSRMDAALAQSRKNKVVTLMDSGNYEKYWHDAMDWKREKFHEVVGRTYHPLCFCYDDQQPPNTSELIVADVLEGIARDQECALGTVAPIVHGSLQLLPDAVAKVAKQLRPPLIAVPERELGNGILERTQTVRNIREALNTLEVYCPLHLLGTGNPLSIISYALAGADSFDGLEWCQTVVDHETGKLLHFQQWDLIRHQTDWGIRDELPYTQTALMHNLYFYQEFMEKFRKAIWHDQTETFVQQYMTEEQVEILIRSDNGCA